MEKSTLAKYLKEFGFNPEIKKDVITIKLENGGCTIKIEKQGCNYPLFDGEPNESEVNMVFTAMEFAVNEIKMLTYCC